MSSASKVGDIFIAAGAAFNQLGELTMQLHPSAEPAPGGGGKWTEVEIDMLGTAVKKFGDDLNKISQVIKNRTISQIRTQLKRKAYDEAGVSPPTEDKKKLIVIAPIKQSPSRPEPAKKHKLGGQEVTLSALNAPEGDVDIESLGEQTTVKKLEFDSDVDSSML